MLKYPRLNFKLNIYFIWFQLDADTEICAWKLLCLWVKMLECYERQLWGQKWLGMSST